jgi:hypothetical protein
LSSLRVFSFLQSRVVLSFYVDFAQLQRKAEAGRKISSVVQAVLACLPALMLLRPQPLLAKLVPNPWRPKMLLVMLKPVSSLRARGKPERCEGLE